MKRFVRVLSVALLAGCGAQVAGDAGVSAGGTAGGVSNPFAGVDPIADAGPARNGLALAPNGDLIVCQQTGQVIRLRPDGGTTTIAANYDGGTLNSPNDAVVRSDGTISFTDPTYGGPGTIGFRGVHRVPRAARSRSSTRRPTANRTASRSLPTSRSSPSPTPSSQRCGASTWRATARPRTGRASRSPARALPEAAAATASPPT